MSRRIRQRRLVVAVVLAALLAPAADAPAERPLPGDAAAVDAYRESIPTAGGRRATGSAGQLVPLEKSIADRLERIGGAEARVLRDVATSPAYGASVGRLRREGLDERDPQAPEALGTRVLALGGGADRARLAVLTLLLAAIFVGFAAVRWRRSDVSA